MRDVDLALERAFTEVACKRIWHGPRGVQKKSGWAAAHQALEGRAKRARGLSVAAVCRRLGMSRQNYYARRQERQRRRVDGELIKALVQRERRAQARLGTRKLYHLLEGRTGTGRSARPDGIGSLRSCANAICCWKLLPAQYPHTTQSCHNLPVFGNRIKGLEVTAPNQVWVSDITYLRTREEFCISGADHG